MRMTHSVNSEMTSRTTECLSAPLRGMEVEDPITNTVHRRSTINLYTSTIIMAVVDSQETPRTSLEVHKPNATVGSQGLASELKSGRGATEMDASAHTGISLARQSGRSPWMVGHASLRLNNKPCTTSSDVKQPWYAEGTRKAVGDSASGERRIPIKIDYKATQSGEQVGATAKRPSDRASEVKHLRATERPMTPLELPPPVLPVSEMTVHQSPPTTSAVSERAFDWTVPEPYPFS
ncbi:hypothetical protein PENSPDRAFT_751764 [Peniophora sp. CONT]|nr:hypothetical protein PENSPDRAFT_751764 [Peniophora sp. CONT]